MNTYNKASQWNKVAFLTKIILFYKLLSISIKSVVSSEILYLKVRFCLETFGQSPIFSNDKQSKTSQTVQEKYNLIVSKGKIMKETTTPFSLKQTNIYIDNLLVSCTRYLRMQNNLFSCCLLASNLTNSRISSMKSLK